jgi:hypothetical protein
MPTGGIKTVLWIAGVAYVVVALVNSGMIPNLLARRPAAA